MREQLIAETERYIRLASEHYEQEFNMPEVLFNLTGTCAGKAARKGTYIRYNLDICATNEEDFFKRTVPHEVAHIVVAQLSGARVKPHGNQWKRVMRLFGAPMSRTHTYDMTDVPIRRQIRFTAECSCGPVHKITMTMRNKILHGEVRICRTCHQRVHLVS